MTWWSMTFFVAILLVMAIGLSWGTAAFSSTRARNVKHAERAEQVIEEHIVVVARAHPEYRRRPRLDHHWFYTCAHIAVFGYSICLFSGAPLTSNVLALGSQPRYTMATCFLVGSSFALTGATFGLRLGRRVLMPRVRKHLTAEVLGDDIALPYWFNIAGLLTTSLSMVIYSSTSFKSTTGSLGGWLTGLLAVASTGMLIQLYFHIRRFAQEESALLTEVYTRLELGGAHDVTG